MQTKIRDVILNITALAGFFAGFYPAVIILRLFSFQYVSRPIDMMIGAVTMLSGYAVSGMIIKDGKESSGRFIAYLSMKEVIVYLTILVPALITIISHIHEGTWRILVEVAVSVFLYYTGVDAHFSDYTYIMSSQKIFFGSVLLSVSMFLSIYILKDVDLKNQILIYSYVFIIVFLIVKNQENLERIFTAGNKFEFSVPKYIRSYNIIGIILVFIAMLIIFYAKPIALYFLQIVWQVVRFIIRLIMKIIYFLSKSDNFKGENGGGGGGMPDLPKGEGNPIADFIFYVILGLVLLFAAVRWGPLLCRVIIRGVKTLLKKTVQLLKKIFKRWKKAEEATEYYVDEDEIIKPEEQDKLKFDLLTKLGFKRKSDEKLSNITDPVLKVRFFYRYAIRAINKERLILKPADTTGEILNKTVTIEEIQPHFTELTDIYERARYGDEVPGQELISNAENWYKTIISRMKKVK